MQCTDVTVNWVKSTLRSLLSLTFGDLNLLHTTSEAVVSSPGGTMGKGGLISDEGLIEYSWEEISHHTERKDRWIVVDGYVYDVSTWARRHPGGEKIITSYAGQDASVSN